MGEGECEWEKHWVEVLREQEREGVAVGKILPREMRTPRTQARRCSESEKQRDKRHMFTL